MEQHIQKIRTTIEEKVRLVEELKELAVRTRKALVRRSFQDLDSISARQQTLMMRLELVRQAERKLAEDVRESLGDSAPERGGLRPLLRHLGAEEELRLLDPLEAEMRELTQENTSNDQLLQKHYHSITAFQQLMDLISGYQHTYGRTGEIQKSLAGRRIEQRG